MSEKLKKKKPFPWWRRILLGLVLTAMGLLTALVLAGYLVGRQLGAEITKVSQAGEPLTFADLEADLTQTGTGKNAAPYYIEALMSTSPDDLENLASINVFYRKNIVSLPANQFPDKLRERTTQRLIYLQPVLGKFDKAAGLPLSRFDIGIKQGIQAYKTRLRRVQAAAFLLSLRTLNLILHGEDEDAASSLISMLKMIRIFDSHPTWAVHLDKTTLVALACKDITLLLVRGRLSEESLARLQIALSQAISDNALERMFLAERVYQMEVGRNWMPKNIASRLLQGEVPDLLERLPTPRSPWTRLRVRQKSTRYFRDIAWLIAAARRPWPEPLDAIVDKVPQPQGKTTLLLESGAMFVRLTAQTLVFVRCTILAIAFERCRRSLGELPLSLDGVSPAYIDSIPLDPFTGKKLLYKQDDGAYLIYSVGINRQDDGGSLIPGAGEKNPLDHGIRIRLHKPE